MKHAEYILSLVIIFNLIACSREMSRAPIPEGRQLSYIIGPDGTAYSANCLRELRNLDEQTAKAQIPTCEVKTVSDGSSTRGVVNNSTERGFHSNDLWWYDPFLFYYPNWCNSYLRWPKTWACNSFWPQPLPRPTPAPSSTPISCNRACLCNVYQYGDFCPAIACTIQDLQACGIYIGPPQQIDKKARMEAILREIDALTVAKFCYSDSDCGILELGSGCGGGEKNYSKLYGTEQILLQKAAEYNQLYKLVNPIQCYAMRIPQNPKCQSYTCTNVDDN